MKKHTMFRGIFPALSSCALLGLLAVVPACSSSTGDTGTPEGGTPATFTEVYTTILSPLCAGCHTGGTGASGSLDMSSQALAYTNLVNKPAEGPLCVSSNMIPIRVVPNQPNQSLLISKVTQATPTCGVKMPLVGNALTTDQVALITEWITAGAMNN